MQRRLFLQSAGASLTALLARQRKVFAAARLDRIGLELYAVRGAMRADPNRTLATIRSIGYTDVELLWQFKNFDQTPQQVRAALDREGLRAPSGHIAPEVIVDTDGWQRTLDTAKELGQQYLIVPSLTSETRTSIDAWRRWADRFNVAGQTARSAGIWLAFHNDQGHMKPIGTPAQIPY